jgi:hypothetical protein
MLDDDLNLRFYLEKFSRQWAILAAFCLAAVIPTAVISWLNPPEYSATVVVTIPAYATGEIYAANLLQNDDIIEAVQAVSGMAPNVIRRITITPDVKDKITFRITDRARSAEQAAREANAWADEGIKWIRQNLLNNDRTWLKKSQDALNSADDKLLKFLDAHELNQYSLIDLRVYEGMIAASDVASAFGAEPIALNAPVREELRGLLRDQANAAGNYSDAMDKFNKQQLQIQTNSPLILNRAQPPLRPINPQPMQTIKYSALALFFGLLAGILFLLMAEWWKNPAGLPAPKN